ncbi:glycosyl hydrolase [Glaciecola sp. 2405UD65-10]|uniref:glycosyl hydrolase n=1 Tax=Glaciecola sp. 2405UD65-10 TaxID=3397244 RepID=UPI003B5A3F74
MNNLLKLGTAFSFCALISGCGNEEPTIEFTPEVEEVGQQPVEDNRLLEPVMLNYLNSIKGNKTVVGVHNREPNSDPDKWTEEVAKTAGVWPGLWSGDFLFSQYDVDSRLQMILEAEKRWKQGMLINIMMHVCPPTTEETCGWNDGGMHYELSPDEWSSLLTDGGDLNTVWKDRLDDMAFHLDYLNKKGVRVLFRPFHEMNQTLFWWSSKNETEKTNTPELYRLTHDYLVNEKDLTNLTFIWNVQDFGTLEQDLVDYDPGSDYWDLLSIDIYGTDGTMFTQTKYDAMVAKAGDKPIAMGEVQHLPTPELLTEQPLWTFVMSWSELTYEHNSNSDIRTLYNADNVVKLDEMPGWTDGNKVVYEVPVSENPIIEDKIIFEEEIVGWTAGQSGKVEQTIVDGGDGHNNVIQHNYIAGETVSELVFDEAQDLSDYQDGTFQFDLKIVTEPDGIAGWAMKIDCGWPCGTGDVALTDNLDGITPVVGEWQTYKFSVAELMTLNSGYALTIDSVTTPLVIVPQPWSNEQIGVVIQLDNIKFSAAEVAEQPEESTSLVVFEEEINGWYAGQADKVNQEIVDGSGDHGNVVQHTYIGGETVSELIFDSAKDLSDFNDGTIEFDLKIVEQPDGILSWAMKIDCGWPCGTGDVDLESNLDGVIPEVGVWQTYRFSIAELLTLNSDNPLAIDSVTAPLVIVPQPWSNEQIGVVIQLDNIRFKRATDEVTPSVDDMVVFNDAVSGWSAGQTDKVTQEVVDGGGDHGNVVQHTYFGGETVSELIFDNPLDLTDYQNGTFSFDMKVVEQPAGITSWAMKIDCGWPCGTGDVALTDSNEGIAPVVGEWQTYTYSVADLLTRNSDNPLTINYVTAPLVVVPQPWSNEQIGVVIQLDNIVFSAE